MEFRQKPEQKEYRSVLRLKSVPLSAGIPNLGGSFKKMGIIPHSAHAIFERLEANYAGYHDSIVSFSYLNIYEEDLCDLLVDLTNLSLAEFSNMKRTKNWRSWGTRMESSAKLSKRTGAKDVLESMRRTQ